MQRATLLGKLRDYPPVDPDEQRMHAAITQFVHDHANCFERTLLVGHITGSSWMVDHTRTHVLLTHHRKLDRWLQLGGHCDGDADVLRVALREAQEESGLENVYPVRETIFDVDVHLIPARRAEPEHFHYDIRFLLEADRAQPLVMSSESRDLCWVPLSEVLALTQDRSIVRMLEKTPRGI